MSNHLTWHIPNKENKIFLTFDDGPHPEVTPEILNILDQYHVKASFFCVGQNVEKYPKVFQMLQDGNHQVGNHTFNHYNGWKKPVAAYVENVRKCSQYVASPLFRPPYGRIKTSQIKALAPDYQIIMWSLLVGDFDQTVGKEKCLDRMIKYTKSGSIIVLHDSLKTQSKLIFALPRAIEFLLNKGFNFDKINQDLIIQR